MGWGVIGDEGRQFLLRGVKGVEVCFSVCWGNYDYGLFLLSFFYFPFYSFRGNIVNMESGLATFLSFLFFFHSMGMGCDGKGIVRSCSAILVRGEKQHNQGAGSFRKSSRARWEMAGIIIVVRGVDECGMG